MIGVEAVDGILFGAPEMTLTEPDWVNGRKNIERCALLFMLFSTSIDDFAKSQATLRLT